MVHRVAESDTAEQLTLSLFTDCIKTKWDNARKTFRMVFGTLIWASLVAQLVKNPPAMQETWVCSLGWEDPLEKG